MAMHRNVEHSGKVHPKGIVPTKPGPTITKNDPAKFDQHGKVEGKTKSNGVVEEAHGPIFHCNETHIPTPNADKPPREKEISAKDGKTFRVPDTAGKLTASQHGDGGATDREYPLSHRYDKHGHEESHKARKVL